MRTLSLEEIRRHLSLERIKEISSAILLHEGTENFLEDLKEEPSWWIEKRSISISDIRSQIEKSFSDQNWLYYLPIFKALQPKVLHIDSFYLRNIPGIETISSLEDVYIGCEDYDYDYAPLIKKEIVIKTLETILLLPKIKKVQLGWYGGNTLRTNAQAADECHHHLLSLGYYRVLRDNNYSFCYELQKSNLDLEVLA